MFNFLALNTENILKALEIMWKGVVAVFIVVALIIIVTKIVNFLCVKADKRRAEQKQIDTEGEEEER